MSNTDRPALLATAVALAQAEAQVIAALSACSATLLVRRGGRTELKI